MSWLILLGLTLLLSAWASGSEMAWVSANPLYWESWRGRHPRRWKIASFFLRQPRRLLITLLLANNLALIGFSATLSHLLSLTGLQLTPTASFWIETLFGTLILLIAGEYLPKALFSQWQLALLPTVVPLTGLFYLFLSPLVEVVYLFTQGLYRLLRLPERALQKPLTRESVAAFLRQSEPAFQEVLTKTLALSETPVREFMVPRREVVALPLTASTQELYETFLQTELSRILIYKNTPDEVIGYVYVRSLLHNPRTVEEVIEPVTFVPETMPATRLLEELVQQRRSLAVVVDARGGMAGIVTTEDLVEEVFGEIQDEYDEPEWVAHTPAPDVYEVDARAEIDYLNQKYGLGLPTDQAVTLGGLALAHLGRIPAKGTAWEAYGFRWEVLDATPQRILTLKLQRL
ncbi:MAG: hemolysin family protein [Bacteroidia bacterium]|jgi:CBS domain containing-hemolysin-like protein|nr:hemolysin family protein [Bacteroidia bacterium]GIV23238.1 MAG: hemolysin [Bacteroidia bacterium]